MREKVIECLAKQVGLKNAVILTNVILSRPVEGCDCTLGELPEQARKMREALKFYSHAIAVIQVESCPTNTKDNPYKERRIDTPHPNIADDALTFKGK